MLGLVQDHCQHPRTKIEETPKRLEKLKQSLTLSVKADIGLCSQESPPMTPFKVIRPADFLVPSDKLTTRTNRGFNKLDMMANFLPQKQKGFMTPARERSNITLLPPVVV